MMINLIASNFAKFSKDLQTKPGLSAQACPRAICVLIPISTAVSTRNSSLVIYRNIVTLDHWTTGPYWTILDQSRTSLVTFNNPN